MFRKGLEVFNEERIIFHNLVTGKMWKYGKDQSVGYKKGDIFISSKFITLIENGKINFNTKKGEKINFIE